MCVYFSVGEKMAKCIKHESYWCNSNTKIPMMMYTKHVLDKIQQNICKHNNESGIVTIICLTDRNECFKHNAVYMYR